MAFKMKWPENFFLLRGNHESEIVNRLYGFYDECKYIIIKGGRRRYNIKLFKLFTVMFNWMPVSAIIDNKIFCLHGGLSPDLPTYDQILKLNRPTEVPTSGMSKVIILKVYYATYYGQTLQQNAIPGKIMIEVFRIFFRRT